MPVFQIVQNLSYENKFGFHENEPADGNIFIYEWFRRKTRFHREIRLG